MTKINGIHHINFVVRDLDSAIDCYRSFFQCREPIRESLPQRGAQTARFKVGDTWIVLVQPLDPDTVPGRYLEEHGEGFFLISYAVDELEDSVARVHEQGIEVLDRQARKGLSDWRVKDLSPEDLYGVNSQLTESSD